MALSSAAAISAVAVSLLYRRSSNSLGTNTWSAGMERRFHWSIACCLSFCEIMDTPHSSHSQNQRLRVSGPTKAAPPHMGQDFSSLMLLPLAEQGLKNVLDLLRPIAIKFARQNVAELSLDGIVMPS